MGRSAYVGKAPTIAITFMDDNKGNICACAFNYAINTHRAAVADDENASKVLENSEELFCPNLICWWNIGK